MPRFFRREIFSPLSRSSHPRGFTLIELSIVMAIVGALAAGFLGAYKVMIAQEYLKTTKDRMNHIQQAMVRFQSAAGNTNQHLPCPARLHAPPSDPAFGIEDVDTANSLTCSTTVVGTAPYNDTFRATDILLPAGTNTVRIGGVPWQKLALNEKDAYDSWGHRFLYAVSENLADPAPAPTYNAANGVITIKGPSGTPLPDKAPFVLISFGKSGFGSVTTEGKNFPIVCPPITKPEGDNCDWAAPDTTFGERTYSEAGDPNFHFDDYIVYSLDNIGGGGGAKNIATLEDGMSDWPANPTTPSNVFLGKGSGGAVDDSLGITNLGAGNTGVGINALTSNTTGSYNTAMGTGALSVNTDQLGSTAIGYWAMRFAYNGTTGYNVIPYNTAVGAYALQGDSASVNRGTSNTAVGYGVLQANTLGNDNTGTGAQALYTNSTGSYNTADGAWALHENTTGIFNTATGYRALQSNTTGNYNTAAGAFALDANQTGYSNTAVGVDALLFNTTGIYNTAVGMRALQENTDGAFNTAVGEHALFTNISGLNNTAIGYSALQYNDFGISNTAVGYTALQMNTGGIYNTAIGSNALLANTSAKGNTAVGYNALSSNAANGEENTAVGTEAMAGNLSGIWNTAVGMQALYFNTTFGANTAVGHQALYNNNAGNNTATGFHALYANTSGQFNTAMGVGALQTNNTGAQNTAVGTTALGSSGSGNNNNTAVGMSAMESNAGDNNTAVGVNALSGNGSNNTAIGYWAGTAGSPYAGNNNTYIGYLAVPGANNLSNATAIGYGATVNASNTVQIGNSAVTDVYLGTSGGLANGNTNPYNPYVGELNNATVHAGHYNSPSDLRLKKDIKDSDLGLDFIEKLRPVSYFYKTGGKPMSYGFIAQEVEKALGGRAASMVTRQNDKMKTYELNYSEIISPLVKAVQEIVAKFHELEKTVAALIAKFNPLEKTVQEQENIITQQQEQIQALTRSVAAMKSEMDALRK